MPRKDPFYTARINKPLAKSLEARRRNEKFPGKLNIYVEWVLQSYADGKIIPVQQSPAEQGQGPSSLQKGVRPPLKPLPPRIERPGKTGTDNP